MLWSRENTLAIRTPEGVVFSLFLAGPVSRFLAWLIDRMCIIAAVSLIQVIALGLLSLPSPQIGLALLVIAYFATVQGYNIVLEWFWNGQTIGKRLFHPRVMDEQALQLQFSQIVMRNLVRARSGSFPWGLLQKASPAF